MSATSRFQFIPTAKEMAGNPIRDPRAPHRKITISLALHADDLAAAVDQLYSIARDLDAMRGTATRPDAVSDVVVRKGQTSRSGYRMSLEADPDMTAEGYQQAMREYEAQKAKPKETAK